MNVPTYLYNCSQEFIFFSTHLFLDVGKHFLSGLSDIKILMNSHIGNRDKIPT